MYVTALTLSFLVERNCQLTSSPQFFVMPALLPLFPSLAESISTHKC